MRIGIMLRHIRQQEGGVKVYTLNLLPRLFALGQEHHFVLMYQSPDMLGTFADYPNVSEVVARLPGKALWDQLAVPWLAHHEHLDLIFNPKLTIPFFFTSAKKVYVVHGAEKFAIPEHFRMLDRLYFQRFMPLYARRADGIVAVARGVREEVIKHLHAAPDKVFAIYNGFDPKTFQRVTDVDRLRDVRERYHLPERFLLWAGQIESRKNVGRLLEAFARVSTRFPHSLVLAGEQRWNSRPELEVIRKLGLFDRVSMPGWIPHADLAAVYSLADLFVFPSLFEGFGIPLIEAMACGCPIVTARTGSPPEVVDGAARLVDPLDVEDIANGITEVLENEELRTRLVARGLQRATLFSWDTCAREVLNACDQLVPAYRGTGQISPRHTYQ